MTYAIDLINAGLADIARIPKLEYGQRAINGLPQRGPDSYDCIGWVRKLTLQAAPELWPASFGDPWTVPEYVHGWEALGWPIDAGPALPGDIVVWTDSRNYAQHIGVAQDATWALSALGTIQDICRHTIASVSWPNVIILRSRLRQSTPHVARSGKTFVPFDPTRLLDTRTGQGLPGPFVSRAARTLQVTGGAIPAEAVAVSGNLTVTEQASLGYLSIGPIPRNAPTFSSLQVPAAGDADNAQIVALTPDGTVSITYAAPTYDKPAHVIFDATGYWLP